LIKAPSPPPVRHFGNARAEHSTEFFRVFDEATANIPLPVGDIPHWTYSRSR
jgi:hypothetical protein